MRFHKIAVLVSVLAGLGSARPAMAETTGPLPRFEDPICPGVVGIAVENAELLVGRIRQNAQALGRQMAPPETCEPNLIVSLVGSGQQVLKQMARDRGYMFDMSPAEFNQVQSEPGPAHVLSVVVTRTRDGMPIHGIPNLSAPPQASTWMAHSRLYSASRRDIVYVLVLFDAAGAKGMTVNQLADYATVRAFVHMAPPTVRAGDESILNLFEAPPGERPKELTAFDHALLQTLYGGIPNLNAAGRLAEIEHATGHPLNIK